MKNLITSLKNLGKKMTGEDVAGTDLVTVVDNIAEGYTGGGGSGGGGGVVALIEQDSVGGSTYTSQLTPAEIAEYLNSGVPVSLYLKLLYSYDPGYVLIGLAYSVGADGDGGLMCNCYSITMNAQHEPKIQFWLYINDNGGVGVEVSM